MRLEERFKVRQEPDGWSVFDVRDGQPVVVIGTALVRLSEGAAAKWADQLNRLERHRLHARRLKHVP